MLQSFMFIFLNCNFLLTDTATACEHLTNTVLHYIFLILFLIFCCTALYLLFIYFSLSLFFI